MATGSTSSAPGDPPGNARRPHPARPAARSHAIVTTPGTGPAPHGAARPPGQLRQPAFQNSGSLRPEWHTGAGREGRFTQSGGGYERLGRSRVPHAECGPGRIFSAVSPGPARTAVRRQPHRVARASPRPPPEALARESRTGGGSLPPAIPYSFTSTCRHRYPRDPGNAQAVPGINLRVNSQTNIRAQLVKQW
jgi:hypothetical protein